MYVSVTSYHLPPAYFLPEWKLWAPLLRSHLQQSPTVCCSSCYLPWKGWKAESTRCLLREHPAEFNTLRLTHIPLNVLSSLFNLTYSGILDENPVDSLTRVRCLCFVPFESCYCFSIGLQWRKIIALAAWGGGAWSHKNNVIIRQPDHSAAPSVFRWKF